MKNPIILNRLEGIYPKSVFGLGLGENYIDFASYVPAKFGNGALTNASNIPSCPTFNEGEIPSEFSFSSGCVELWHTPENAVVNGRRTPDDYGYVLHFFSFSSPYTLIFGPFREDGFLIAIGEIFTFSTDVNYPAGIPVHLALTWNHSGIPGTGGMTAQFRVNGIVAWETTASIPASGSFSTHRMCIGLSSYDGSWPSDGIQDNFKFWDFPKTKFLDRFNERAGCNDEVM